MQDPGGDLRAVYPLRRRVARSISRWSSRLFMSWRLSRCDCPPAHANPTFSTPPPVIVQTIDSRAYPCPSWLIDPKNQVLEALYLPAGVASEAADSYVALSKPLRPIEPSWQQPTFLVSERSTFSCRVERAGRCCRTQPSERGGAAARTT